MCEFVFGKGSKRWLSVKAVNAFSSLAFLDRSAEEDYNERWSELREIRETADDKSTRNFYSDKKNKLES